jgi:MFS family permease
VRRIRAALAVGSVRFSILALLFFATAINYIDRAALGVMQPVLAKAMSWTASDYADINFWFQLGYAIGFAAQGRFIDWIGVKRAFALAVLLWSIAAAAHGLAATTFGFMLCRFFLGITEAANFPANVKTARLWFPAGERALAAGVFNAGATVGAMLTPALLPPLLAAWGWQAAFFAIGSLGVLWFLAWVRSYHDPETHPHLSREELRHIRGAEEEEPAGLPYSRLLRLRVTWAFTLAYSLTVPVFWFYLYWLPPFLNQQYQLGIRIDQIGLPLIVIYLSADLGGIVGGGLSSYLIARGIAPVKARLVRPVRRQPHPNRRRLPRRKPVDGGRRDLGCARSSPIVDHQHVRAADGRHAEGGGRLGVRFRQHGRRRGRNVHDPDRGLRADDHRQQLRSSLYPDPLHLLGRSRLDFMDHPARRGGGNTGKGMTRAAHSHLARSTSIPIAELVSLLIPID